MGREQEIEMVIGILSRKNKNNPALVGEPGVGKTAIAEGLAQRMSVGDAPSSSRSMALSGKYRSGKYRTDSLSASSKALCVMRM